MHKTKKAHTPDKCIEYYTNLHSPRLPDAKRLPIKRLAREAAGLFVTRAAIESRSFNLLYNVLMGQFLTVFSGCNWHLFCLLSHLLITPCAKHSTSAVWWRNGRSKQKRINLRGRNKLEKRRGRRRRGGRKVATKECKCYTACIYIYACFGFERSDATEKEQEMRKDNNMSPQHCAHAVHTSPCSNILSAGVEPAA